jgi:hypothetical protein
VLDDVRHLTALNVVVDAAALRDEGICVDCPVTLQVQDVTLKSALNLLLRQAHLTYVIRDEVVLVTTDRQARGKLVTKTFHVGDLVCRPGGAGDRSNCQKVLVNLVTNAVAPQSWNTMGGDGTVDYFPLGQSLVVSQTPDVQEQIAQLLMALRLFADQQAAPRPAVPTATAAVVSPVPFTVLEQLRMPAPPYATPFAVPTPIMPAPPATAVCPQPIPVPPPAATAYGCPLPASVAPFDAPVLSKPESNATTIKVVKKDGQARLQLRCEDVFRTTCEEMTWKICGHTVKVTARDEQILLSSNAFEASADRIVDLDPDGRIVLKGHARLWINKEKHEAGRTQVVAENITIGLQDGTVQFRVRGPGVAAPVDVPFVGDVEVVRPASRKR